MISEADRRIWHKLDTMSQHFLDPSVPWQPESERQAATADLIRRGILIDSGRRQRWRGKLQIVWILADRQRAAMMLASFYLRHGGHA
jgi:hypothetical protein